MTQFIDTLVGIFQSSGFARFGEPGGYLYAIMICVGCFLLYLAIVKEFEPLILLPMAFGMILANLPGSGVIHMQYFVGDGLEHPMWIEILNNGGLADMLYMGVKLGIYPMLIKCLPVGHLMTNCYIVTDETTLECAVIDPGDESKIGRASCRERV